MTGTGDWDEPRGYDHTFPTGRVARLRVALSVTRLARDGLWNAELAEAFDLTLRGELTDQDLQVRLGDALVIGMFIKPRVVPNPPPGEEVPEGAVPISWLDEDEITETIRAAYGGPALIALFRGEPADDDAAPDGAGVADAAVEPAGVGAGKRRSSGGRRSSGKPSA